jgi:proline iminopeptidase
MVRSGEGLRAPLDPPPQPDDPAIWRVEEDIDLHHFSHGTGTPVLFLHGGPGFPVHEVPPGVAALANECEIHLYDQRGCGRSTKPFDRFSSPNFYRNMIELHRTLGIAAQIADIERIRRILGQDKLILFGHSFGGFLATLYAAEFPDRVEAMVLIAPADLIVFPQEDEGIFKTIRSRLEDDMTVEFDRFTRQYFDFGGVFSKSEVELAALNREFARFYMIASEAEPGAHLAALEESANGGWMVTASYFGLGKRHDYRNAVRKVQVPTLVIQGENDLQPVSVAQGYAELLANAQVHVLEGASHFLLEEHPVEFAEAVRGFLAQ